MDNIKVGVIGGGWFANFHLDNLKKMDGVDIVALATGNRARLTVISDKVPKAHTYTNQNDMIEQEPHLDSIIVCVPPDRHDEIEFLAAQHHIHLYMEKPIGVSLEKVLKCERAINESGIICSVGYQTRYNPHLDEIKTFLRDQKIGCVVAKWIGPMPQTPWWRIKERSGGQFAEQVTHMVDALRYLFGDIDTVYSRSMIGLNTGIPNYNVEDCSTTVMTFKSGLLSTLTCGCFLDEKKANSEIRFEIYTDQVRVDFVWDTMISFSDKQQGRIFNFGNEYHYVALQTFIEAVRTGDPSAIRSLYSDSVMTFLATLAANRSMETHQEICCTDLLLNL